MASKKGKFIVFEGIDGSGKNLDLTSGSCTCLMSGKGWQW